MYKKSLSKFWIVIDHPQQLAIAILISKHLKKEFKQKSNLVISKHAYWKGVKFIEYRGEFSKVKWFDRLDYPPPWLNLQYQFVASLLLIPKIYRLAQFVKNLEIQKDDVIIGLSTQQFLENKILKHYSNTKKIGIVAMSTYDNSRKLFSTKTHNYSLASFMVKLTQLIFGMHEVICVYRKRNGPKLDGDTIQRYKKPLTKIYDYLMVMKNNSDIVTPLENLSKSTLVLTRYPYTYNLPGMLRSKHKKVIFLGEDFLSANNIDHDIHAKLVNKCLNFLRRYYGKKYDLIYKPHPRWNKELKILDVSGFDIYKDHDPAELFFIKNRADIHAVFSVISTASRSAINCGLSSYVFYKLFPFDRSVKEEWSKLLGELPRYACITSFDQRPGGINVNDEKNNHKVFVKHLNAIISKLVI